MLRVIVPFFSPWTKGRVSVCISSRDRGSSFHQSDRATKLPVFSGIRLWHYRPFVTTVIKLGPSTSTRRRRGRIDQLRCLSRIPACQYLPSGCQLGVECEGLLEGGRNKSRNKQSPVDSPFKITAWTTLRPVRWPLIWKYVERLEFSEGGGCALFNALRTHPIPFASLEE